jgi:hypothetical protein
MVVYFLPDGDDDGVGIIVALCLKSGVRCETPNTVTVDEWNEACKAAKLR